MTTLQITQLSQLDLTASYSYADYLTWQFDETVELIKGKIQRMSPAPNVDHQRLSMYLSNRLYPFFKSKPCQVFAAPFDVRLYDRRKSLLANQDIHTVVQPDLCVICDKAKLDTQGCNGAPDWVIEILSRGNSNKDVKIKHQLYQESGVREYWVVYPYEQVIHAFVLDENSERYALSNTFAGDDMARPQLFPDLVIDLQELFAEE
ncbi:MAG: Uma2 family endonuclease [Methylococcaceae bacterium]|nr:MAG: Uma2 family endonuclease [Methylococcaceae bacterium]